MADPSAAPVHGRRAVRRAPLPPLTLDDLRQDTVRRREAIERRLRYSVERGDDIVNRQALRLREAILSGRPASSDVVPPTATIRRHAIEPSGYPMAQDPTSEMHRDRERRALARERRAHVDFNRELYGTIGSLAVFGLGAASRIPVTLPVAYALLTAADLASASGRQLGERFGTAWGELTGDLLYGKASRLPGPRGAR